MAGLVALGASEGTDAHADVVVPSQQQTPPKPPRKTARAKTRVVNPGLVATLPGFEMLPDGGSRLFVELTHTANVTERKDARSLTYVIQGAHVVHRNNENALVTVHFNTPVTRARLLPVRGDVVFSVELRADTASTWKLVDGPEGSSVLQIDFPSGAFIPAGEYTPGDPGLQVISGQGPGARVPIPASPGAPPGPPGPPAAAAPPAAPPPAAPPGPTP